MVVNVNGLDFIIDDEDFRIFNSYKWNVSYSYHSNFSYLRVGSSKIWFHRLILGVEEFLNVDHKNRNTLDNRKENLRICPRGSFNAINRPKQKNNTSGYKGVFLRLDMAKPVYRAQIRYLQKLIHLGKSENPAYAASMYDYVAINKFGEFAFLNNSGVELTQSDIIRLNELILKIDHSYTYKKK